MVLTLNFSTLNFELFHALFKRIFIPAVAVSAFAWASWVAVSPAPNLGDGSPEVVGPGVVHRFIIQRPGPWRIHLLEIDLRRPEIELGTVRANDRYYGRETVSSMARRKSTGDRRVIAAINGDYFNPSTGEIQNNQIAGGEFVKAFASPGFRPEFVDIPNSQFALTTDRRPSIDQYMFEGFVLRQGRIAGTLSGVNVTPRRGGLTLFNRYFGEASPATAPADSALHLPLALLARRGDTLFTRCTGRALAWGGLPLSAERIVLAAYRSPAAALLRASHSGDTLVVVLSVRPRSGSPAELIGGWPRLVRNGRSVFDLPGFPENPATPVFARRHPRAGIGFSRDGRTLFLLTVDGRHKNSAGMSLPEFASLMVSLGIYQGLNLDGGGSVTMLIDGDVVNAPSDLTGERPVGNCLLVYERHQPPVNN